MNSKFTVLATLLILLSFLFWDCRKSNQEILESAAKNPSSIEKLDLGIGKLGTVPDILFGFPNLKWLDIRMNELHSLPENAGDWTNLEYLNIFGNDISELPESFRKLPHLKVFFAGTNDFVGIPPQLIGPPIQAVYLDQNKITLSESDIDTISSIPTLEVLDLARNRTIVSFPKNLGFLASHPKLRTLILKETGLKPSQVQKAKELLPKLKIEF
ncbi:leucine-rich repeat domain-containing protein [Leptospira wolffii]|uniref:leucine-rich repeat domain-containing protein n=1 Tax=Leptospira wolffii TaxID=409998 RepID=UPI001083C2BB|nr:leucine-rich repeat domain-containing protein [Leptospira wolffii]TGK62656.1 leucine-rich repeat domain-containing protein [Leptospira wolffii]TGK65631.1 leucine-rich repeat domain-containing protein [Leptospira wolffii]TGK73957.1 leucine-rich repeat domain-containing protein [Leptospira wolffii]TGL28818.1 leucine-rich repeat domain-containing protein [Leptospira wolffii]